MNPKKSFKISPKNTHWAQATKLKPKIQLPARKMSSSM